MNNPTEKEKEILDLLQEECAEVIQIASKIKRFGWESHHPEDVLRITNRDHLEREIADVMAICEILISRGLIIQSNIDENIRNKIIKLKTFGVI